MFRGIGNYSLDFLRNLINGCDDSEVTLITNGTLSMECIDSLTKEFSEKANIEIRTWFPLPGTSWLADNLRAREVSETIYNQVVLSTKPDFYILLSPFEGLTEDICWKRPERVFSSVIFYDAIPAIFPERYLSSKSVREWYFSKAHMLRSFDLVLTISKSASHDAISHFNVDPARIHVIHFGLREDVALPRSERQFEDYVLAVLGEDERKNKVNLINGWAELSRKLPSLKLKIVYKQSEAERHVNSKLLNEMNLNTSVVFLDFVSNETLSELYSKCLFTVFPSFYEGLGLPVLESYSYAKPCIVADCSSLPELVTNEELRFNPNSPTEIAECVIRLMSDSELYLKAVSEGQKILKKFQVANKKSQISWIIQFALSKYLKSPRVELSGVYLYTILPPLASGIANYADHLIHQFHLQTSLILVSDIDSKTHYECRDCGMAVRVQSSERIADSREINYVDIHNIGNSEYHLWQVDLLMENLGIVILHDGFLSGLFWSQYREDSSAAKFLKNAATEVSSLKFSNSSYFYEPHKLILEEKLDQRILESAVGIVVHSKAALDLISESFIIANPNHVTVVPHFSELDLDSYNASNRKDVVGVFGIIAESKMYKEIISAWSNSRLGKSGSYTLRFIGEDLSSDFEKILRMKSSKIRIEASGYLDRVNYLEQLNDVRFAIQLRRGFRGETSGALTELISRGIPVITNIDAWIESFPEVKDLQVSEIFTIDELSRKIDWVKENLDGVTKEFSQAKLRIESDSSPKKCVTSIIRFANSIYLERENTATFQFKELLNTYNHDGLKGIKIEEVGDVYLRSFPHFFNKKRILVVLSNSIDPMDKYFRNTLAALNNLLNSHIRQPIFYCRFDSSTNSYECLIESVIPVEVETSVPLKNFLIRLRSTDEIVNKSSPIPVNLESSFVFGEIKSKLGIWLAD